ncbi:MAG: ATP-dependent DNA ligase [Candidatus Rokubacteria bacterium]|nr:ATP-dependent DNA ligase [Candidatus Rokubacteria bacterium]
MTPFADFVALCRRLSTTPGRLDKRRLTATFLGSLDPAEVGTAVAFLTGRPFPPSDPRVLGVRGLPGAEGHEGGQPLMIDDVLAAFAAVADATGSGSRRGREQRLRALARRASDDQREILARIIGGEMRTGVSEGVVLEALAEMAGADLSAIRRAALFLGDLSAVAALLARGGAEALASVRPRPFVPLLPMLAEIATDFAEVLAVHGGRTALEFKYDGARIQLHRDGERVGIWTRRLSDVTRSLPDVVALARRDLGSGPFIVDGEVVALDAAGRPLPFQELMRRFRRIHDVEAAVAEMPLALHLFDCLVAHGEPLIDRPYAERWDALARLTRGRFLAERRIVTTGDEALEFRARALAEGHEGVMAKDLASAYEPGGRGKRWFKLKAAETIDCVIIAADRGSGRRIGWLSNYHLAVRDGDGFADVGKTFKGLTDAEFAAMTDRLWTLAVADDGYTVRVTPEVVVEVEYNEIQKSPTYPSGLALRFARIARIREDKAPGQATTLEELTALYERQFATKGRGAPRGSRVRLRTPPGAAERGGAAGGM